MVLSKNIEEIHMTVLDIIKYELFPASEFPQHPSLHTKGILPKGPYLPWALSAKRKHGR